MRHFWISAEWKVLLPTLRGEHIFEKCTQNENLTMSAPALDSFLYPSERGAYRIPAPLYTGDSCQSGERCEPAAGGSNRQLGAFPRTAMVTGPHGAQWAHWAAWAHWGPRPLNRRFKLHFEPVTCLVRLGC